MRVITWDLEIQIDPEAHDDGWDAARRGDCGISSVALYDTATGRFHVYDAHTIDDCVDHLNEADVLVGFNSIDFDTPCIEGYADRLLEPEQYDILHEIWSALNWHKQKGYSLDAVCERALQIGKAQKGKGAVRLFHEGRYAELIDYNINDVHLTRQLANYVFDHGHIIDVNGEFLEIPPLETRA